MLVLSVQLICKKSVKSSVTSGGSHLGTTTTANHTGIWISVKVCCQIICNSPLEKKRPNNSVWYAYPTLLILH